MQCILYKEEVWRKNNSKNRERMTEMKQFSYHVDDPNGMHARPAGALATFAKQFDSRVSVRVGEKTADGKRLLSLMSLGATQGSELCFGIEGEDEELAAELLERFCKETMWKHGGKKDAGANG